MWKRNPLAAAFSVALVAILWSAPIFGHGTIHQKIASLTKQLASDPENAELYFKRGLLRIDHREFDLAVADFERAAELDSSILTLDHERARALRRLERTDEALTVLDAYLERLGENSETLGERSRGETLYGEILEEAGRHAEAADAYLRALKYAAQPLPEHFLNPVRAWHADDSAKNAEKILNLIDQGVKALGAQPSLESSAIEAEVALGRIDAALARVDRLIASTPRAERWWAERGRILADAGRIAEARDAYEKAVEGLESLSPQRRRMPDLRELEESVREALEALPSAEAAS